MAPGDLKATKPSKESVHVLDGASCPFASLPNLPSTSNIGQVFAEPAGGTAISIRGKVESSSSSTAPSCTNCDPSIQSIVVTQTIVPAADRTESAGLGTTISTAEEGATQQPPHRGGIQHPGPKPFHPGAAPANEGASPSNPHEHHLHPPQPPSSYLTSTTPHPSLPKIRPQVESHFLSNWPFDRLSTTSGKDKAKFVHSDFVLWACLTFSDPSFSEEKLKLAAELVCLGFLVDDYADTLQENESRMFLDALDKCFNRCISDGTRDQTLNTHEGQTGLPEQPAAPETDTEHDPFSPTPIEQDTPKLSAEMTQIILLHQYLWRRILRADQANLSSRLALAVVKSHLAFVQANFSPARGTQTTLDEYWKFRTVDAGTHAVDAMVYWLCDVTSFELTYGVLERGYLPPTSKPPASIETRPPSNTTQNTSITSDQSLHPNPLQAHATSLLKHCQATAGKHFILLNDLLSYDRELARSASTPSPSHPAPLINALPLIASTFSLDSPDAKHLAWATVRALERRYLRRRGELLGLLGHTQTHTAWQAELLQILSCTEARIKGNELWSLHTGRYKEGVS